MTFAEGARPRVRPSLSLVPTAPTDIYVHGPGGPARLTGAGAVLVRSILPLLDGERTVAQIAERSGLPLAKLQGALRALAAAGIVEDAAATAGPGTPFEAFLQHASPAPAAALARLGRARVAVLGEGPLAEAVAAQLAAMGLRGVVPAPAPDAQGAAQALAATPDALVLALEAERPDVLRAINRAALARRIPWVPAVLHGRLGECGPTVVPGESSCWRCYDLRRKGANPWLDQHIAYEALAEAGLVPGESAWGAAPSLVAITAGLAAQEAAAVVTAAWPPALRNHVALVEPLQASVRRHRVLRLPRCPACGASDVPDVDRLDVGGAP